MINKFISLWSFVLGGSLFLVGCGVTPSSAPLAGFFGTVEKDYPHHPLIEHVSLVQNSDFLQANTEYHTEVTFDPSLFSETTSLFGSGSTVTLKLDVFETNEITTSINQIHKMNIKGSIDLNSESNQSNYEFEGKIYLFTDSKTRAHYLFIDEMETKKSGKSIAELDLRFSLLNTQLKRRIRVDNSKFLDYLQVGFFHKIISKDPISNRRMEDPNGTIYTSGNKILDMRMQTNGSTNIAALNFINEKIRIQASSGDSRNYLIEGDRGKEKYGGEILGTLTHEIDRTGSVHTGNGTITFPKGLNASFSYREKLSKLSNKTNDYQFPNQYVSFDSLIKEPLEN